MAGRRVDRDIVFGMYSGLALLMDAHRPEDPNGLGLLFVGGSGWQSAPGWDAVGLKDKENQLRPWLPHLVDAGYTVFAVNHRAAPRFPWPAALEDLQRALRFVRARARDYGIDARRLGAVAGSSGAHLACMAALAAAPGAAGHPDPVEREEATLQCLVLREAPTDLLAMAREADEEGVAYVRAFMEGEPLAPLPDPAAYAEASPLAQVRPGAPPMLLIHGDADSTVPFGQSLAMVEALAAAGTQTRLLRIPGGLHSPDFGADGKPRPDWPDYIGETLDWLDRHLGAPPRRGRSGGPVHRPRTQE